MVLLVNCRSMCASSWGLRQGYAALHGALGRAGAAVWPGGMAAAAAGAAAPAAPLPLSPVEACLVWEPTVLILAGFLLATWAAFRAERRLRASWLCRVACGELAAPPALKAEAAIELRLPPPSDLDYLLELAAPAVACLTMVARGIDACA